jgi:plastocyanin domain-containing protein
MNTTQIVVTIAGFGLIAWIVWYFWLWKGEAVTARAGAGGVQVIDVTVRGAATSLRPSWRRPGRSCA